MIFSLTQDQEKVPAIFHLITSNSETLKFRVGVERGQSYREKVPL